MTNRVIPIVLEKCEQLPEAHQPLIAGNQLDANTIGLTDRDWNYVSISESGEFQAIPTDGYLDYNGNAVLWGDIVVTPEYLNSYLSSLSGIPDLNVVTPEHLSNLTDSFNAKLAETTLKFREATYLLYSLLYTDFESFDACSSDEEAETVLHGGTYN